MLEPHGSLKTIDILGPTSEILSLVLECGLASGFFESIADAIMQPM